MTDAFTIHPDYDEYLKPSQQNQIVQRARSHELAEKIVDEIRNPKVLIQQIDPETGFPVSSGVIVRGGAEVLSPEYHPYIQQASYVRLAENMPNNLDSIADKGDDVSSFVKAASSPRRPGELVSEAIQAALNGQNHFTQKEKVQFMPPGLLFQNQGQGQPNYPGQPVPQAQGQYPGQQPYTSQYPTQNPFAGQQQPTAPPYSAMQDETYRGHVSPDVPSQPKFTPEEMATYVASIKNTSKGPEPSQTTAKFLDMVGLGFITENPSPPDKTASFVCRGEMDFEIPYAYHHVILDSRFLVMITDTRSTPHYTELRCKVNPDTCRTFMVIPRQGSKPDEIAVMAPRPETVSFIVGILRFTLFMLDSRPGLIDQDEQED